ncbi:MAG: selenocysteine lyase, partial [Calditrichaeota bacterium]|nr:selenocysteine lyase [Calditrichota bacterium]
FGIQFRGGCSCAGTYGHYLLNIPPEVSHKITDRIDLGDYSEKPGWIRLSIHPIMTDEEIHSIIDGIRQLAENYQTWQKDYRYNPHTNEYTHVSAPVSESEMVARWFELKQ